MIFPPNLHMGNTIGITCPAAPLSLENIQPMLTQLEQWGFKIVIGQTIGNSFHTFSDTDANRRKEFQHMLDDDSIDAILFGRGGYGVVRIIDGIDFSTFIKKPKWLVGYSDITCIHNHIHSNYNIATIHAHMSGGYMQENKDEASTQSILDVLTGKRIEYTCTTHPLNKQGVCSGVLTGGNLAVLSDLIGTNSDINTDGKIFCIEDIGEYSYNIDRMLWQLYKSNRLKNLAGLLVGGFTDTKNNDIPFFQSPYESVLEKITAYNYPVCFDFPIGHQARNMALKFGSNYTLNVANNTVTLFENMFT